jgi:hypothetical protein
MGEGTARLGDTPAPRPAGTTRAVDAGSGAARVRALGEEIEEVRACLDVLADELDRRRHAAFDWRLQLRRHVRASPSQSSGWPRSPQPGYRAREDQRQLEATQKPAGLNTSTTGGGGGAGDGGGSGGPGGGGGWGGGGGCGGGGGLRSMNARVRLVSMLIPSANSAPSFDLA